MKIKKMLLLTSILTIAACTHTLSTGDKMLMHSDKAKKLGEQWTKGEDNILKSKKMEKKGNKLISSGNNQIAKGKKNISKGENQVDLGNKMLDQSRTNLKNGHRSQHESELEFIENYPGELD